MGIQDFGGANDPLANPPLGGPSGWAASVADAITVLQGKHEARSTRPNGTDRLVEVFDGTAWTPVHYDSGVRLIDGLLTNGWTPIGGGGTPANRCTIQRLDGLVILHLSLLPDAKTSDTAVPAGSIPDGFKPSSTNARGIMHGFGKGESYLLDVSSAIDIYGTTTGQMWTEFTYAAEAAIPTSLPGTTITTAP